MLGRLSQGRRPRPRHQPQQGQLHPGLFLPLPDAPRQEEGDEQGPAVTAGAALSAPRKQPTETVLESEDHESTPTQSRPPTAGQDLSPSHGWLVHARPQHLQALHGARAHLGGRGLLRPAGAVRPLPAARRSRSLRRLHRQPAIAAVDDHQSGHPSPGHLSRHHLVPGHAQDGPAALHQAPARARQADRQWRAGRLCRCQHRPARALPADGALITPYAEKPSQAQDNRQAVDHDPIPYRRRSPAQAHPRTHRLVPVRCRWRAFGHVRPHAHPRHHHPGAAGHPAAHRNAELLPRAGLCPVVARQDRHSGRRGALPLPRHAPSVPFAARPGLSHGHGRPDRLLRLCHRHVRRLRRAAADVLRCSIRASLTAGKPFRSLDGDAKHGGQIPMGRQTPMREQKSSRGPLSGRFQWPSDSPCHLDRGRNAQKV